MVSTRGKWGSLNLYAVVPFADHLPMTNALLDQLLEQSEVKCIFVYDNGSSAYYGYPWTDSRVVTVGAYRWGLHQMLNSGVRLANQDANGPCRVALLNNDLRIISSSFLSRLAGALENPNVGIAGAQLTNPGYYHHGEVGIHGCALMVRGEDHLTHGPLNEKLQFWYGDTALVAETRLAGKEVVVVDEALVEHLHGGSVTSRERGVGQSEAVRQDEKLFYELFPMIAPPSKQVPPEYVGTRGTVGELQELSQRG